MTEGVIEKRRARWRAYYYRHPDRSKKRRDNSLRRNAALVDSLKDPCARCGIADKRVIDFHHLHSKDRTVAEMRVAGRSSAAIRAEIAKCLCLCANCHRIVHWEERHHGNAAV